MAMWERVLAFAAGASLVAALPLTDEIGFAVAAAMIGQHWWRSRASAAPA
jgi:TRAP-type uncharacterized transport system fused permease subunit